MQHPSNQQQSQAGWLLDKPVGNSRPTNRRNGVFRQAAQVMPDPWAGGDLAIPDLNQRLVGMSCW